MRSSSVYAGGPFSVLYYFLILMVTTDLLPTLVAAPSGPPLNFSVEATTPRTLYFSWEPPLLEQQNGVKVVMLLISFQKKMGWCFKSTQTTMQRTSQPPFSPHTLCIDVQWHRLQCRKLDLTVMKF